MVKAIDIYAPVLQYRWNELDGTEEEPTYLPVYDGCVTTPEGVRVPIGLDDFGNTVLKPVSNDREYQVVHWTVRETQETLCIDIYHNDVFCTRSWAGLMAQAKRLTLWEYEDDWLLERIDLNEMWYSTMPWACGFDPGVFGGDWDEMPFFVKRLNGGVFLDLVWRGYDTEVLDRSSGVARMARYINGVERALDGWQRKGIQPLVDTRTHKLTGLGKAVHEWVSGCEPHLRKVMASI